jgi:hypothetical protein
MSGSGRRDDLRERPEMAQRPGTADVRILRNRLFALALGNAAPADSAEMSSIEPVCVDRAPLPNRTFTPNLSGRAKSR